MRKFFIFASLVMLVLRATAADVSLTTAQSAAMDFLQRNAKGNVLTGSAANSVKLLHSEANSSIAAKAVYYIFNSDENFVIVSGDDRAPQILAYGDRPFDLNAMPDNMRFWLSTYKEQIEYLQAHPGLKIDPMDKFNHQLNTPNIEPMLTAKWAVTDYFDRSIIGSSYQQIDASSQSDFDVQLRWKF